MAKGYGAGTVFHRADGKWVAMWERPRLEGERRRGTRVASTEAAAWKRMREAQRVEGRSSSPSRHSTGSVAVYLDRWLRDVVTNTRREKTLLGYRFIVSSLPERLGSLPLGDISVSHEIQAWLNEVDRHPRTIHSYAACLRTAFAYAVRKGMMERNPALGLDLPAITRTDRIPLTADELRIFLAAVEGPLRPLWVTAAWTGMRSGELLGLRWENVSLDRAEIVVRQSLSRLPPRRAGGPTRYVLTEPKTPRSRRTIPLVPDVVDVLRPLRKEYLRAKPVLDQGLVFATPSGSPIDAARAFAEFQAALRSTGTRKVRLHDLRHTAATLMIESGMDLATVSDLLGHSTISTTVGIYGHLTSKHRTAAMARFRESIG